MEVPIDVTELPGSETLVHYTVPVPPVVTPEIEELLADTKTDAFALGHETRFSSRISPDAPVAAESPARLVVDAAKRHFFHPDAGRRIGYRPGRGMPA